MRFNLIKKLGQLALATTVAFTAALGQTTPTAQPPAKPAVDHTYKPLTLKLTEDGSKYVRFIMWHQVWMTATQNNPGTVNVRGKDIGDDWSTSVAMRRSRFLAYSQISPRALILTHWGINNQSPVNGGASAGSSLNVAANSGASNLAKRPQIYLHDAYTEFELKKDKLYLGAGLHYWNGISRLTSQSTLNFMTLDAPIFNWATIEAGDQFARMYGIYAKGQLGRLDYRLSLDKPFVNGKTPLAVGKNVAENVLNEHWAEAGYIDYMFWDKESDKLPYFVGTHLGAKKLFNLGAGFYHQKGASLYKTETDSTFQDHLCLGADAIVEYPLNRAKGTMLHVLATFYDYDFGKNYIRNIGILNEHPSVAAAAAGATVDSWAGGGNLQPTIGTGQILYAQVGYLMPKMRNGQSLMPYLTTTYKKFERLADPSVQFGLGLNYLVTGHNAKVTLEYATRPVYKANASTGAVESNGSRGQLTCQFHVFI